jgi:hypothetical protein
LKEKVEEIGNSKIGTYPLQVVIGAMKSKEEISIIVDSVMDKLLEMCQVNILVNYSFRILKVVT